jgi:hypothetical protein
MRYVAVETVGDDAAAAVLVEALGAHGIAAQARRVAGSPYGPAKLEIEVRVPADQAADARAVLERLAEEAEAAARRESRMVEPHELPARRRRPSADRSFGPERQRILLTVAAAVLAALVAARVLGIQLFHFRQCPTAQGE